MADRTMKFAPALVFGLPFLVYLPTLWGTFYYDDNVIFFGHQVQALAQNPFLVFQGKFHFIPGAPRSVHVFVLLVIYKFFGAEPFAYHFLNLTLHCLTTLLVYLTFKKLVLLSGGGENVARHVSVLGALLFGLHPIHVENITFVTLGGTDLFYTTWAMLSLLLYLTFRGEEKRKRFLWLLLSTGAFYLALLSKESAITFVLVFPLAELAIRKKGFLWATPHAAIVLISKAGYLLSASKIVTSGAASQASSSSTGIDEVFHSLGYFIRYSFIPYPQSTLIKEFPAAWTLYVSIAAGAACVFAAAYFIKKQRRLIVFSALWFGAAALPYLFVPYIKENIAITAERYIYAPSAGFALFISLVLVSALGTQRLKKLSVAAAIVLLTAYSALGVVHFYDSWRDEGAFWSRAIKMNPEHVSGYIGLSSFVSGKGDAARAERILRDGISRPKGQPTEFAQATYNLGLMAQRKGDLRKAESYYLLSLRYGPFEFSFTELGFIYLRVKNLERAKWAFGQARRFPSRSTRALYGYAKTLSLMGDKETARRLAVQIIRRTSNPRIRALAQELLK